MSRRSDSNLVVIIILAIGAALFWILKTIWEFFQNISTGDSFKKSSQGTAFKPPISSYSTHNIKRLEEEKALRLEEQKKREGERKKAEEEKMRVYEQLMKKTAKLGEKDIIYTKEITEQDKIHLLMNGYKYTYSEAQELLETAEKETRRAKLYKVKRDISKKAFELYGGIPSDDNRTPIPDEVKLRVWQRDSAKCTRCGSNEKLEYDHIIPVSKGGSNTERNIQLLCESCNRSKSDNI